VYIKCLWQDVAECLRYGDHEVDYKEEQSLRILRNLKMKNVR